MKYSALSIVAPNGQNISKGQKVLEIRSWQPEKWPLKNLIIVENLHYLSQDKEEDLGFAVALVDIESVHEWQSHEVSAACATAWQEGYYAWVISNIRPIEPPIKTIAKRKIYTLDLCLD